MEGMTGLSRLGATTQVWRAPAAAVIVAIVMNTLVKLALAWVRGAGGFRRKVAVALGAMSAVGAAAGLVVYLRG